MCYLVAKDRNAHGCFALKTTHGKHLVELKRELNREVGYKGVQLVTISRPTAYGEYAPDYREKKRAVRKAKRQLDMDEHVAAFRYSETQLQSLLDQIVQVLAEEVSNEIKVDAGSPFFETKKHFGCGGNCHAIRQ